MGLPVLIHTKISMDARVTSCSPTLLQSLPYRSRAYDGLRNMHMRLSYWCDQTPPGGLCCVWLKFFLNRSNIDLLSHVNQPRSQDQITPVLE